VNKTPSWMCLWFWEALLGSQASIPYCLPKISCPDALLAPRLQCPGLNCKGMFRKQLITYSGFLEFSQYVGSRTILLYPGLLSQVSPKDDELEKKSFSFASKLFNKVSNSWIVLRLSHLELCAQSHGSLLRE
jgi:hypothetical protein